MSIFVIQSLQQEILFFSLPFVLLSTTLHDAGQVVFAVMLMAAAVVSTIDPLYEKYIATTTLASITFQSFCSFVAALIVLPIVVQVPLGKSFYIALAFVIAWLVIVAPAILTSNYSLRSTAARLLVIISIPLILIAGREHIPAAGLQVSKSRVTSVVENHEPGAILSSIHQSELADGLYAYSSISAPKGLEQEIIFHWKHENHEEQISSQIIGGREEGFRTYSFKENFIEQSEGNWTIDITTAQGQLLERLEFIVYI
ncbi:MAG: hypothetical protein DHS20C12_00960 [Pseudohongiella sp.]|nr:MAG: hypothetical protein DHS20C12_00960 [Pseudohongiella sp.]